MYFSASTKDIARATGTTTAAVNEIARDLQIEMDYNKNIHSWMVTQATRRQLTEHIIELNEQ